MAGAVGAAVLVTGLYSYQRDALQADSRSSSSSIGGQKLGKKAVLGHAADFTELPALLSSPSHGSGSVIVVVGPSGSGKRSILHSLLAPRAATTLWISPRAFAAYSALEDTLADKEFHSHLFDVLQAMLGGASDGGSAHKSVSTPGSLRSKCQRLFAQLTADLEAAQSAGGAKPIVVVENVEEIIRLAQTPVDKKVLEGFLLWLVTVSKHKDLAHVILSTADPYIDEKLEAQSCRFDVVREVLASASHVSVGEAYTAKASESLVRDLAKQHGVTLSVQQEDELVRGVGTSFKPLADAMLAIKAGYTVDQAIDRAVATKVHAAKAVLESPQAVTMWEVMNFLDQEAGRTGLPFVDTAELLSSDGKLVKALKGKEGITELLHDRQAQELLYYFKVPSQEMVLRGASPTHSYVAFDTAALRAMQTLVKDDHMKRQMWERKRR